MGIYENVIILLKSGAYRTNFKEITCKWIHWAFIYNTQRGGKKKSINCIEDEELHSFYTLPNIIMVTGLRRM